MSAKHFDDGKARVDLMPWDSVQSVSEVFGYGAEKYGEENWIAGMPWRKLLGSALRHLIAWSIGIDKDLESGKSHLAHAACNILMLMSYQSRVVGDDNRIKVVK